MRYARVLLYTLALLVLFVVGIFGVQSAAVQSAFLESRIYWPTIHLCGASCVEELISSTDDHALSDLMSDDVLRDMGSEAIAGLAIKHSKNSLFEKAYGLSKDPYRKLGWQESSLLNIAVYFDNEYAVSVLARDKKFLSLQNGSGRTPLMDAVILRRTKIIPQLIPDSRAPLDMADMTGERPVERALLHNLDPAYVCLLMPSGGTSSVNIQYLSGQGHDAAWWQSKVENLHCGVSP